MAAIDTIRIVVVGDSGVGKTSLVHLMCHQQCLSNPGCTIGCSVEIYLHEYKAGTPSEKTYFVEFWDIGGSASHKNSRSIFYSSVQGVILVHDLGNRKSLQNLPRWLAEVLNKERNTEGNEYDPEQFAGNQTPIMITGTRSDSANKDALLRTSRLAEECGADDLILDCHQVKSLAPGSTNAVKLSKFLDKVIERRYHSREFNQQSFPAQTASVVSGRRTFSPYNKASHID